MPLDNVKSGMPRHESDLPSDWSVAFLIRAWTCRRLWRFTRAFSCVRWSFLEPNVTSSRSSRGSEGLVFGL